jgi:heterodisulfide reductase subunit A
MRTGIYFCQVEKMDGLNIDAIAKYASNLQAVESVEVLGVRPRLDPELLAETLKRSRIERVVIAGDQPGYFKPVFTRSMALAGQDPTEVYLASFRARGATFQYSLERAKAMVACATLGVPYALAAIPAETPVHPATLIIGGGVAGIQAALEIADAGKQVYLVERSGTIVGQHDMIDLISNAEVTEVSGTPGAYRAKILKKARRVDAKACVACSICSDACPISVPSDFDANITTRKAIYVPFPQAVPNAYLVDASSCTYVKSKKCGACAKKCPKECINLDEQDETIEVEVGNIIIATGYDVLDAGKIERYGYGKFPNVLTALEFERLTNASGPTGGKIITKTNQFNKRLKKDEWVFDAAGQPPKSVAIIHCVGSRDASYNSYCSRVCCMYSLKFAHLVKEKLHDAVCYEFYIDMRAFGKGYEEFAERIKQEGAFVVRGRSATVTEADGKLVVKGEDIVNDRLF